MKTGNLIFCQGNGFVSKLIRFIDKGEFSHVAIVYDSDSVIEAEYDTRAVHRIFNPDKYNKIAIADFGLTERQTDAVMYEAQFLLGKRYDYLQLLGYIIKRIFRLEGNRLNNPNNLICSELVFIVLDKSGVLNDLNIKHEFLVGSDLTPNQLFDLINYSAKSIKHIDIKN